MPGEGRKNREKGDRRERELIRGLRAQGFYAARARGSLGAFDFIAENRDLLLHVQVKSNEFPSPAEREELLRLDLFRNDGSLKVLVRVRDTAELELMDVLVSRLNQAWVQNVEIRKLMATAIELDRSRRRERRKV